MKTKKEVPVFLTETRVEENEFASEGIDQLETMVSSVSQMSQSTMLLKKRKEMREIDDALDFMREEYAQRIEACEVRRREFEKKQHEMKDQVSKFEKFIRENDAKRQRAEQKEKSEHRLCQVNEIKRRQLVLALQSDNEMQNRLKHKVDQLRKYRTYLESVVEYCGSEYDEIEDALNRYWTLKDCNEDLKSQVTLAETGMDQLRLSLRTLKHETQNKVLVQNSEINRKQHQVEALRAEGLQLDLQREQHDRTANSRTRESGQIVLSVKNLYQRCCASLRLQGPQVKDTSSTELVSYMNTILKTVEGRINDLDYIVTKCQQETGASTTLGSSHK